MHTNHSFLGVSINKVSCIKIEAMPGYIPANKASLSIDLVDADFNRASISIHLDDADLASRLAEAINRVLGETI